MCTETWLVQGSRPIHWDRLLPEAGHNGHPGNIYQLPLVPSGHRCSWDGAGHQGPLSTRGEMTRQRGVVEWTTEGGERRQAALLEPRIGAAFPRDGIRVVAGSATAGEPALTQEIHDSALSGLGSSLYPSWVHIRLLLAGLWAPTALFKTTR